MKVVKAAGGLCPKFVSPGTAGMPDRLLLLPGGRILFVEVKAPGKKPHPLQKHRHEQLRALGFREARSEARAETRGASREKEVVSLGKRILTHTIGGNRRNGFLRGSSRSFACVHQRRVI